MNDIDMTMGERIKKIRREKGLTQRQLGEMVDAGNAQCYIWTLEKGHRGVKSTRMSALKKVAKALDVSVAWLLTGRKDSLEPQSALYVPVIEWHDIREWKYDKRDTMDLTECEQIPHFSVSSNANVFSVRIENSNVNSPFRTGDIIIIDPGLEIEQDKFVIAARDEDSKPDLYIYSKLKNSLFPADGSEIVNINDETIIYGVVVASHRKFI